MLTDWKTPRQSGKHVEPRTIILTLLNPLTHTGAVATAELRLQRREAKQPIDYIQEGKIQWIQET